MDKEFFETPVLSDTQRNPGVPLSPVARANGFQFVPGLPPLDSPMGQLVRAGVETQSDVVLRAPKHVSEGARSSPEKVVKTTTYVNRVYARYFLDYHPERKFVAVGSWPLEFDVEVECFGLA